MIESWDDVITDKQHAEIQVHSVEALVALEHDCQRQKVRVRLEIAYMDGKNLCYYPASFVNKFFDCGESGRLVIEDNFRKCGGGKLYPVSNGYSLYNSYWAVEYFRLTPKFLREFSLKLFEKVCT